MAAKLNYLISFALILLLSQGVKCQRQCESNWRHRSGFCYLFSETLSVQSNWEDAKQDCRDRSGNLATIIDEDIWDWIVTQITSQGLGEHWIGLRKTNNQYYWDDGTVADNSKFYWTDEGQSQIPNTCVVVTRSGWREELCSESSYYHMCYKKATARDQAADALVVFGAIFAALFILFILILFVYHMMPEEEVKHEKLDKHVKKSDEQEAKKRRQRKGDLEKGVQEVTSRGQGEKADVFDEGEVKKRRKERAGAESARDQKPGVVKGRTPQKTTVESRGTQKDDVESENSQKAYVEKDVQSSKGYDNRAFDNNNE